MMLMGFLKESPHLVECCSICLQEIMHDPVVAADGFSYEREVCGV
jgi:hypothetical protein